MGGRYTERVRRNGQYRRSRAWAGIRRRRYRRSTVLRGLSLAFPVRLLGARPLEPRTHRGGDHRLRGDDGGDILRYGRGDRESPVAAAAGKLFHRHALLIADITLIWRPWTPRIKSRGAP